MTQVVVDDAFVIDEGPDPDPTTAPPSVLGAFDQALHAAVDIGIARAALEDAARFVTANSRPWFEAKVDSAAEEPHIVRRFGELTARLYALEALLAHGSHLVDAALAEPELSRESAAAASLKVAAAKALAQEFAVEIASGVFELTGTSATDQELALDRHACPLPARPRPLEVRPPRQLHAAFHSATPAGRAHLTVSRRNRLP